MLVVCSGYFVAKFALCNFQLNCPWYLSKQVAAHITDSDVDQIEIQDAAFIVTGQMNVFHNVSLWCLCTYCTKFWPVRFPFICFFMNSSQELVNGVCRKGADILKTQFDKHKLTFNHQGSERADSDISEPKSLSFLSVKMSRRLALNLWS